MLIAIAVAAAHAVLFVREQHHAHGALRADVQLLHQARRFPRHHAADAVVRRARARIPRIEVAADEHDLLGLLAALDLADDVEGFDVGIELRLHLEAHADLHAAIDEALDAIGVLRGDRRGRNLRDVVGVVHAAGVRRAQAHRADRAHERRNGAVTRRHRRAAGSILHRLAVIRVRHVEEHDLALRFGGALG